jgi:polysaccharide export outer membrane protein
MHVTLRGVVCLTVLGLFGLAPLGAQSRPQDPNPGGRTPTTTLSPSMLLQPYIIGPDDVLHVDVWRNTDLTRDYIVRPDGKMTIAPLGDVQAVGLRPEALAEALAKALAKYFPGGEEPVVTVEVKQINSRKVFIVGNVAKPGPYPLTSPTTVMQLITMAGGLTEFADKEHIVIVSLEQRPDGTPWNYEFNYVEYSHRMNLKQNIELKPGDQVIVR